MFAYVHYTSYISVKFVINLCMHTNFRELLKYTITYCANKNEITKTNYTVKKGKI